MNKRLSVFSAAVFAAVVAMGETRQIVKSGAAVKGLFPWFEIGETVDAAKEKGVRLLHTMEARPGLRAHAEYVVIDTGFPTNHAAWVTLSVPDRKVLQIRHDINCSTTNEVASLSAALAAKFKPLEVRSGGKFLEICPAPSDAIATTTVCAILSDADYAQEFRAWFKKASE